MSIMNMVKNIKEIHPKSLLLFKVGAFCEGYGKDSYIISYLFNYQVRQNGKNNISKVGFSKKAIPSVISKLEEQKIDYLLIDVRNNYYVDEKFENRNLNKYDTVFEKAYLYVRKQREIRKINEKLMEQIDSADFKEKVGRIEEILNEGRKV
jgi:DNA mismatch repair ATPase MutS